MKFFVLIGKQHITLLLSLLSQICHHCNVDDKGTNYPDDRMVHPSVYDTKDFHDSLMAEFRRNAKKYEESQVR